MEEKDLKQIKEVIDQSFDDKFGHIKEVIDQSFDDKFGHIWEHNLAPAFDDFYQKFEKIEGRLDKIEGRVNNVESQMATKSYIDDKMADLEGRSVVKIRKEDEKVNKVIDLLKQHKIVPVEELKELDNLQIFPRIQL